MQRTRGVSCPYLLRTEGISGVCVLEPGNGDLLNILEASLGRVGKSLGVLSGVAACSLLCFKELGRGPAGLWNQLLGVLH